MENYVCISRIIKNYCIILDHKGTKTKKKYSFFLNSCQFMVQNYATVVNELAAPKENALAYHTNPSL